MIVIIDYGLGNLSSIKNMLIYLGSDALISSNKSDIKAASKLIIPGVGSFDSGINNLNNLDLISLIKERALIDKIPILGICLGAQLLLESSDEGIQKGLGLVEGKVNSISQKFKKEKINLPVPNMGWRDVEFLNQQGLNFGISPPRFYFVHSYFFKLKYRNHLWCLSNYGITFCAGFKKNNITGVQFHPEKSHQFGMQILKYLIDYV